MIIIIKKVSTKVRIPDIKDFIIPVVRGNLLEKSGRIKRILMLSQKNLHTGVRKHHFLVEVDSDFIGNRVIRKLNRKTLAGKLVEVHEYKHRNWHNDQRINHSYANMRTNQRLNDRRIYERRQKHQEFISEPIQIKQVDFGGYNKAA